MLLAERDALLGETADLRGQIAAIRTAAPLEAEISAARADGRLIVTEYRYQPKSRPIERTASGVRLSCQVQTEERRFAKLLTGVISKQVEALRRISRQPDSDPLAPCWENDWFQPLDAVVLYGLIADLSPRQFIEVGSGMSTRFARKAIQDLGLTTRIVSVDPHPHSEIDAICDKVIRAPWEDLGPEFWEEISGDDLPFVDNSHRSFPNSDVTVFFAEILPDLPPGMVWGLHDIFLPWDYPDEWRAASTMSRTSYWPS